MHVAVPRDADTRHEPAKISANMHWQLSKVRNKAQHKIKMNKVQCVNMQEVLSKAFVFIFLLLFVFLF